MMKLFLASEAKNPQSIMKLKEYVGGFDGKSIVYIPTASNGEEGWESWKKGESWNLVKTLGFELTVIQLEEYRDESVIKLIEGKNIIWFAGGMPGYLMYWIRRCGIDLHIKRLLENGTLYVGSSAGAMVTGKTLQMLSWNIKDERGSEWIKPMNLVDFDIFPHYEDSLLNKIKENYNGNKLYLLKNGEEIIVEDSKIDIIGEERLIIK